jgi:hypothetical protein
MTRGTEVLPEIGADRAARNTLNLQRKRDCLRIVAGSFFTDELKFAQSAVFSSKLEEVACEQTPGPRGSGED